MPWHKGGWTTCLSKGEVEDQAEGTEYKKDQKSKSKKNNPCCNILVYPYAWSTSALSLQSQPASCCSGCQHPWQPNPSFQSPIRLSSILCIQVKHALWILLGCSFVGQMLLDLVYRRMMLHVLNSNFRARSWIYPQLSSLHCTTELCVDFFGAGKPGAPADRCRVLDHLTTQCFPTCPRCKHHQWLSSRLSPLLFLQTASKENTAI